MPEQQFYTIQEVADILHVDRTTVGRWIASGALPAINPSGQKKGHRLIKKSTLNTLLEGINGTDTTQR